MVIERARLGCGFEEQGVCARRSFGVSFSRTLCGPMSAPSVARIAFERIPFDFRLSNLLGIPPFLLCDPGACVQPGNVLLSSSGGAVVPKVSDMGLAVRLPRLGPGV
jgi:hypothetical protein